MEPARTTPDLFFENGRRIFQTAHSALLNGEDISEVSILIGDDGSLRLVMQTGWSLDSLQAEHGAPMAYRVRRQDHKVRMEGRAGVRTCLFEAAKPDGAARLLLANDRLYQTAAP